MRGSVKNKARKKHQSVFCVVILFWVLASALFLGSIRLYGLYLEQKLADCTIKIENVGNKYAILEEYHASLLSPSRIYNYAKSQLNMVTATRIETIRLMSDSYSYGGSAQPSAPLEVARTPQGLLSRIFVGTANAKD
jgi:hypothetical protein